MIRTIKMGIPFIITHAITLYSWGTKSVSYN